MQETAGTSQLKEENKEENKKKKGQCRVKESKTTIRPLHQRAC